MKVQSFLKKHKKKLIILGVVLVILFLLGFMLVKIYQRLSPNEKQGVYGDRCDLTESIMISEERKKTIKEVVEANENMKLEDIDIKCNLIDIVITVDDSVSPSKVKTMSDDIIKAFTEEELKYYDLEIMADSGVEESENYPIMGTKHKMMNGTSNAHFVWS